MTRTTQGSWSADRAQWPINHLEMRAMRLALLEFRALIQHQAVRVLWDNTSTVAYINSQGGTGSTSLTEISFHPLKKQSNLLQLGTAHVAGKENLQADFLSRHQTSRRVVLGGHSIPSVDPVLGHTGFRSDGISREHQG